MKNFLVYLNPVPIGAGKYNCCNCTSLSLSESVFIILSVLYNFKRLPSFAGERTRRPKVQDTLTILICQTSTYTFKDIAELIAFQVLVVSDLNGNCSALDFSFLMDLMLWRAPIIDFL